MLLCNQKMTTHALHNYQLSHVWNDISHVWAWRIVSSFQRTYFYLNTTLRLLQVHVPWSPFSCAEQLIRFHQRATIHAQEPLIFRIFFAIFLSSRRGTPWSCAMQTWLLCFPHPHSRPIHLSVWVQGHHVLIFHDYLPVWSRCRLQLSPVPLWLHISQFTDALATWWTLSVRNILVFRELFVAEQVRSVYGVQSWVVLLKCQVVRRITKYPCGVFQGHRKGGSSNTSTSPVFSLNIVYGQEYSAQPPKTILFDNTLQCNRRIRSYNLHHLLQTFVLMVRYSSLSPTPTKVSLAFRSFNPARISLRKLQP